MSVPTDAEIAEHYRGMWQAAEAEITRQTERAEAAEQQAARLRAASDGMMSAICAAIDGWPRAGMTRETLALWSQLRASLRGYRAALDASQPAPADVAVCPRTLDCTKQAGHDSWCTVVLISDVSRCPSIYSSPRIEGVRCWRPAGHEGVHEDRGLRWDAPRGGQADEAQS